MSSENDPTPVLFKTVTVIWSDVDPTTLELSELAREAEMGEAICTISRHGQADPALDASFIGAEEFFNFEPEGNYLSPDPSTYTPAQIRAALERIDELGFGADVDADDIVRSAATSYLAFAL
jgi:hypothetical protein